MASRVRKQGDDQRDEAPLSDKEEEKSLTTSKAATKIKRASQNHVELLFSNKETDWPSAFVDW